VSGLPPDLQGPVKVALAKARDDIPAAGSMSGGATYELKWDGFRCTVVRDARGTRLWSRQGKDLTDHFPVIADAASVQMPPGTVVDGEHVIWNGTTLDFDPLQRRLVNRPSKATVLASESGQPPTWSSTCSPPKTRTCVAVPFVSAAAYGSSSP
jgi:ATP-dependent DNA ligase